MASKARASVNPQLNLFDPSDSVASGDLNSVDLSDLNPADVEMIAPIDPTSTNALDICSQYFKSLQKKKDIDDVRNAMLRYFIPSVGGPVPSAKKYKPMSPSETEDGLEFLKTVPLASLANAADIALKVLDELNSSPSQHARVRYSLNSLVEWAQKHGYIALLENPIPEGVCAHIKVGAFTGLNLKPANARQIFEQYLEQIDNHESRVDTLNSIIRFFVPACGGPFPQHKPPTEFEYKVGLQYLEAVPLEYLNDALAIATVALKTLNLSQTQCTRIRNALRSLIKWARAEQYLPKPDSVAPWGGEHLVPGADQIAASTANQPTLFEMFEEYQLYLKQNGKITTINVLQTAIIRYLVPSYGGPVPMHARATTTEVQEGLSYLKTVLLEQPHRGIEVVEVEFNRLQLPLEKRRPIRSRLRNWFNWLTAQSAMSIGDERREPQPVFNTFYTNGIHREQKKPGMKQYANSSPVHVLCAKRFTNDYINDDLEKQLDSYVQWRRLNGVTSGSFTGERTQILQVLGWLHRYEGISLSELRLEKMITKSRLLFQASDYKRYQDYLRQKEIGTQEARKQAANDQERVERYLAFKGENAKSQSRYVAVLIAVAKFLYKDLIGSDDFPRNREIPIIRRLLDLQLRLKKKAQETLPTIKYSETSSPWEQVVIAMEKERFRADLISIEIKNRTKKGYKVEKRSETAIANDLQRFLSIAFCVLIPSRSRTFYDLCIGETFKEGILTTGIFLSVLDLKNQGKWDKYKEHVKFYIHHKPEDFKVGKSMTPALLESDGWWVTLPDIQFSTGSDSLYDYIRRWLDWGRAAGGDVKHNFFFRQCSNLNQMNSGGWNARIKSINQRWTGMPIPPKNMRKMFASQFPEYKESAALLLQHSTDIHDRHYDMRQTDDKMRPVMDANKNFINKILTDKKVLLSNTQADIMFSSEWTEE